MNGIFTKRILYNNKNYEGVEKGNIKVILEGMIEVAVVDLGQDQEQVLIEIE